jgi:hypothetical protein
MINLNLVCLSTLSVLFNAQIQSQGVMASEHQPYEDDKMHSIVILHVMLCSPVGVYLCFGESYYLLLTCSTYSFTLLLSPKDGDSVFS